MLVVPIHGANQWRTFGVSVIEGAEYVAAEVFCCKPADVTEAARRMVSEVLSRGIGSVIKRSPITEQIADGLSVHGAATASSLLRENRAFFPGPRALESAGVGAKQQAFAGAGSPYTLVTVDLQPPLFKPAQWLGLLEESRRQILKSVGPSIFLEYGKGYHTPSALFEAASSRPWITYNKLRPDGSEEILTACDKFGFPKRFRVQGVLTGDCVLGTCRGLREKLPDAEIQLVGNATDWLNTGPDKFREINVQVLGSAVEKKVPRNYMEAVPAPDSPYRFYPVHVESGKLNPRIVVPDYQRFGISTHVSWTELTANMQRDLLVATEAKHNLRSGSMF